MSIQHDVVQPTSMVDEYVEYCTGVTGMLYDCANVETNQQLVRLNVGTPTPMRGPGIVPGLFPLESAMDELAVKLNMDPMELRLKNYAETDRELEPAVVEQAVAGVLPDGRGAVWMGEADIRRWARCGRATRFWAGGWRRRRGTRDAAERRCGCV